MDAIQTPQNKLLGKTFFIMFLGLLGSGLIAWYTYSSGLLNHFITENSLMGLIILELVVVLIFSFFFRKLPAPVVGILFFVYSMINGLTLSTIFYIFELSSIVYLFIVSSLVFLVLGVIGYKTSLDLSKFGIYLSIFLVAGLVLTLINLFILQSSTLNLFLDWFILLVFFGITIYDLNKLKLMQNDPTLTDDKIHIYFAMQLYLDFINIFLRILSIFGKRK